MSQPGESKKYKKKEIKKAEQMAKKTFITGTANVLAPHLKQASAPKKGDSKFMSFAKKALSIATDLVPLAIPFLFGSHAAGPAVLGAKAAAMGVPKSAGYGYTPGTAAPLATGSVLGSLVGVKSYTAGRRDSRGNVQSMKLTSMDFVKSLPAGTYSQGDVIDSIWVNPLDPDFEGTKFALYAQGNERWVLKTGLFFYEPVQPATIPGALSMCVFNDPLVDLDTAGAAAVLNGIAGQDGADEFQLWAAGTTMVPCVSGQEPYYTSSDNQDIRLSVAGKLVVVAASDLGTLSTSPGNIYFLSETEYLIPSIAAQSQAGAAGGMDDPTDVSSPAGGLVTFSSSTVQANALGGQAQFNLSSTFTYGGSGVTATSLRGLDAGSYLVSSQGTGTTLTAGGEPDTTDDADGYSVIRGAIRGAVDTADWETWSIFTVPVGVPPEIPLICWLQCTGASMTNYRTFIVKFNPDGAVGNTPSPSPNPRNFRGLPKDNDHLRRQKRMDFFLRSSTGQLISQRDELSEMRLTVCQLKTLITQPSAVTPSQTPGFTHFPLYDPPPKAKRGLQSPQSAPHTHAVLCIKPACANTTLTTSATK